MTNFLLRITFITTILCLTATLSKAQIGNDYSRFDLGASLGSNQFNGDVVNVQSTKGFSLNFNYNQSAFLNYIFEFQGGKLAGGNKTTEPANREFAADYDYLAVRAQLQAGEIMDYSQSRLANAFKNFYIGAGVGVILDNITSINRYSTTGQFTPGLNKSQALFVPLRVGYEIKIFNKYQRPDFKIDIAYQYNSTFTDNLDGYKVGKSNDSFSQFSIGVKFAVGGNITAYRKQINY